MNPVIGNDLPEQGGLSGNMLAPVDDPATATRPRLTYNTTLSPVEEQQFASWKQQNAPNDTGEDYDLRGAFKAGIVPDGQTGHWPDTFKKPNHPTFSNESQYATGTNAAQAGRWNGDQFIAPTPVNMLAPQDPEVYGQPSRSGQIMDETATRSRRVETDKRGRPTPNTALSGDEQTLDYQNRLATMQPDKEGGGWWPKIRAALSGLAVGGPAGAAVAFGTRALREHLDPTLGSREYRNQELGRVAPAVEAIRNRTKDAADIAGKTASTNLANARTKALTDPKAKAVNMRIVERKDGVYAIDPVSLKTEKIGDIPPEAGSPGSTRYISRADGVYGINDAHPNGFKISGIPGNKGKDAEDVTFGNQQINQAISEAQAEQAKIDAGMANIPQTIESTDIFGAKKMVPNPQYTYNMTRRRQLDDQIRNWRIKLKSGKKPAAEIEEDDPLGILGNDE